MRLSKNKIVRIEFTDFSPQNCFYALQNLSFGFILKIFLKFRKCQPRYSYKIYSYKYNKEIKKMKTQDLHFRVRSGSGGKNMVIIMLNGDLIRH